MSGAEPDDNDRTVIRPSPGGRASAAPARVAERLSDPAPVGRVEASPVSGSGLAAAASRLLQLLARLSNAARPPDAGDLRQRVVHQIEAFERHAGQAAIPADLLRPAHFALCASIDDVVLNTPWGSDWGRRTLISTFHRDADAGREFFEILHRLLQDPAKYLPVIELMYLCLSLGFMGRYRPPRGDPAELEDLRQEVGSIITQQLRGAGEALSPRWKGVAAPYRAARRELPVWVAAAGALAVAAALFVAVSSQVNAVSDSVYTQLLAAPPNQMPRISRAAPPLPAPPPAPEPDVIDRLKAGLAAEIDVGHLLVTGTAATPILRIAARGVFLPGSAAVQAAAKPWLERIGALLRTEPGSLQVIGYTDNQPTHTLRFPSNFQLSLARAQAVRSVMLAALGDAGRITVDGRADADPIASNATADGRELNRRIEIVLHRQDQQD